MKAKKEATIPTILSGSTLGAGTDTQVYSEIHRAIAERRLEPGQKLTEEVLVDVFQVSRARIRRVLLVLANESLVKLEPNRGAFVWHPSVADARNTMDARRLIELEIAGNAAEKASDADVKQLRLIVDEEQQALKAGDEEAIMRLSGHFHAVIADIAGNPILTEFLRQLISRCYLVLATYQQRKMEECSNDDHAGIVDAIVSSDQALLERLVNEHFDHIERSLDLREDVKPSQSLREVFGKQTNG